MSLQPCCKEVAKEANKRIEALEELLVCYRVGRRPSERLFNELNKTKNKWEELLKQTKR